MDLRYHQYVIPGHDFYRDSDRRPEADYGIEVPDGWTVRKDEDWTFVLPTGTTLPVQGWKIHLSARVDDAEEVIARLLPVALVDDLAFKVTRSPARLLLKNSKYGDRSSSGKFITVYPRDEEHFMALLDRLHDLTADLRPGPYVLSDRRWRDGLVYYRYGAFAEMRVVTEDGQEQLALRHPDGTLVPDTRGPVWSLPDFVELPARLVSAEPDDAAPFPYQVESALHFSNGGGVYKALDRNHTTVVLKEGRPGAGIDARGRDAVERIDHEAQMMTRFRGTGFVPELVEVFDAWEHRFMAQEYVHGVTLNSWIAAYFPFAYDGDGREYVRQAITVVRRLERCVLGIHEHGIALGDLQPLNVMVDDDLQVRCIDLECAGEVDAPREAGLMTLGYTPYGQVSMREADLYGLAKIARQAFLPIGPAEDLAPDLWDVHVDTIRQLHGDTAADLVQRLWTAVPERVRTTSTRWRAASGVDLVRRPDRLVAALRAGILKDMDPGSPQLVPGDIRQYTERFGTINVRNGGAGACLALLRSGGLPDPARAWLRDAAARWLDATKDRTEDYGLFTGGAGLGGVLWEAGMQNEAAAVMDEVLDHVAHLSRSHDRTHERLTVDAGHAGILLQLLAFHRLTGDERFQTAAVAVARDLVRRYDPDQAPLASDPDAITIGLFEGWTGCGLALAVLCDQMPDRVHEFEEPMSTMLASDIRSGAYGEDDGAFTIVDGRRLIPYLAGGGAGTLVALRAAERSGAVVPPLDGMTEGALRSADSRSFYNAGLLRGTAGLISAVRLLDAERTDILERLGRLLGNFLVDDGTDAVYLTGDFGYRLSHDLGTGSAGLICALVGRTDVQAPAWMPLPTASYPAAKERGDGR